MASRLLALLLCCAAVYGQRATTPTPGSVIEILSAYDRGDYDAVAALPPAAGVKAFGERLADAAPKWISAAGPDAVARRRLIAATVALEAARPAMERHTYPDVDIQNPIGARLVEWGCAFLREAPTHPAERWWQVASLGLGQVSHDELFLVGVPKNLERVALDSRGQVARAVTARGPALNHLAHARTRFPDEPRLRLIEVSAQQGMRDVGSWTWLSRDEGKEVDWWVVRHPDLLKKLGWSYAELTSLPSIRAEAHLRAGVIEFRFGRFEAALKHLEQVEPFSTEPFLVYLSRFFRAKTFERQKQPDRAEAAYRSALQIVPNAGSAATALAALLFLTNRRVEANAVVEATLTARPEPVDPWRQYSVGDHRLWPEYIRRIREAIR